MNMDGNRGSRGGVRFLNMGFQGVKIFYFILTMLFVLAGTYIEIFYKTYGFGTLGHVTEWKITILFISLIVIYLWIAISITMLHNLVYKQGG